MADEIKSGYHCTQGARSQPAPRVYIVGPNMPQNQLLCAYLASSLPAECSCHAELPATVHEDSCTDRPCFYLRDCLRCDLEAMAESLAPSGVPSEKSLKVVLFNVDTDCRLERLVRAHKIKGIFYREDSRSLFLTGMRAIVEGELWLRRKTLSRCVLVSDGACTSPQGTSCNNLSLREKEILYLVAGGSSNQEIADLLKISVHTVKTHLYNTYKKIEVPNRLQATLWANTYLQGMWSQSEGSVQVSG